MFSAFRQFFTLLVQTSEHRTLDPEDPGSLSIAGSNAQRHTSGVTAPENGECRSQGCGTGMCRITPGGVPGPIRLVRSGRLVFIQATAVRLRHGTPKQGAIAQTESTCLASRRLAVRICLAPPDPPDRFGRSETIFRVPTGVAVAKRLTRRDVTPVIMGLNPIGHPCGYSTTRIGSSVGRAPG